MRISTHFFSIFVLNTSKVSKLVNKLLHIFRHGIPSTIQGSHIELFSKKLFMNSLWGSSRIEFTITVSVEFFHEIQKKNAKEIHIVLRKSAQVYLKIVS